ncbi:MAG: protein translocase subunit SecD [Dehalococcoidia bacterium]|nr:protein translocase subunit SecD [Dehalococcoidia bacterium]
MGRKHILTLVAIFVIAALCVSLLAIENIGGRQGFSLGLDLQGGTHLVYEADFTEVAPGAEDDAVEVTREIIEKRINRYGISEPNIQIIGSGNTSRISVQIPGVTAEEARALVGAVAEMDFREQNGVDAILTEASYARDTQITIDDATGFVVDDTCVVGFGLGGGITKEDWETRRIATINGSSNVLILDPALFLDHQAGEPVSVWIPSIGTVDGEELWLTGRYLLPNSYVDVNQQTGQPVVAFEFDETGAILFAQITGRIVGEPLGIFLDNEMISAPIVQTQISGGSGIIEGLTYDEARILSSQLNGGALPLPLGHWDGGEFYPEPAVTQSVDATLGADSLHKSLIAGIIGLMLVMAFMILYYRLPGLLACFSLLIYTAIMLTIFKMVPVTLTMASIAAFILSIGMAVDANVLIFERMKEEIRSGKTLRAAVEAGFNRAWPAIRDGNVSTLITCIILFWFGSRIIAAPLVMGFALTLGIGVVMSMLTAIVVTRTSLRTIVFTALAKRVSLFRS